MSDKSVVALNGFFGDRRGLDVTDIVNPRALDAGRDYYLTRSRKPGRGGAGFFAKRHFYRWCRRQVEDGAGIIMVGKSYGAHWILDAIEDLHIGAHVHAFIFDPTCVLHPREKHVRKMVCPHCVTVVRQLGQRSGYQVAGANDNIIDAKHSSIERTEQGRCMLDAWLTKHGL